MTAAVREPHRQSFQPQRLPDQSFRLACAAMESPTPDSRTSGLCAQASRQSTAASSPRADLRLCTPSKPPSLVYLARHGLTTAGCALDQLRSIPLLRSTLAPSQWVSPTSGSSSPSRTRTTLPPNSSRLLFVDSRLRYGPTMLRPRHAARCPLASRPPLALLRGSPGTPSRATG